MPAPSANAICTCDRKLLVSLERWKQLDVILHTWLLPWAKVYSFYRHALLQHLLPNMTCFREVCTEGGEELSADAHKCWHQGFSADLHLKGQITAASWAGRKQPDRPCRRARCMPRASGCVSVRPHVYVCMHGVWSTRIAIMKKQSAIIYGSVG